MGFDAEDNMMLLCRFDAPRKFVATALPGVGWFLDLEINAWQGGDVARPAGRRIVERLKKPITCPTPARRFRMIDGVSNEARIHLQEHIGAAQAALSQLASKLKARPRRRFEHL